MHTNINTETGINAIENILYKSVLNQFGTLWWNIDNLSRSTTFLDLQLTIKGNKIKTKTLQKPMKLFLYTPPTLCTPIRLLQKPHHWRIAPILETKFRSKGLH